MKATGRGWSACRRDPCLAVNLVVVISCATKTALLTCCATISPEKASPGSPGSLRSQRSSMCSAPGRAAGPEDASAGAPATGVIVIATAGHFRAAASSASSAAIREARWEARNLSAAFCSRHSRFDSSCLSRSATSSACAALRSASPGGGWPRKSAFAAQGELREVTAILGSPRCPSTASDAAGRRRHGSHARSVGATEGWHSADVHAKGIIHHYPAELTARWRLSNVTRVSPPVLQVAAFAGCHHHAARSGTELGPGPPLLLLGSCARCCYWLLPRKASPCSSPRGHAFASLRPGPLPRHTNSHRTGLLECSQPL